MVQDQRPCRSPGGCLGLWSVRWGESQVPGGQPPPASMFSYACPSQTQDAVSAQVGCFWLLCAMQAVPRQGENPWAVAGIAARSLPLALLARAPCVCGRDSGSHAQAGSASAASCSLPTQCSPGSRL